MSDDNWRENWQKRSFYVAIAIVVAILTLASVNLGVGLDNRKLVNEQLESLAPLNAELHIEQKLDKSNYIYSQNRLNYFYTTNENKKVAILENNPLILMNLGRLNTGEVLVDLKNDWLYSKHIIIGDMPGQSQLITDLEIFYMDCYGSNGECNLENLPSGVQELELEIACKHCEPSVFHKTITICIQTDDASICDEWYQSR